MKRRIIYALFFLVAFSNSYSQKREKEAHYYYLSLGTCVYTNSAGTFNQKTFVTTEFGGSFGIFDIGIMVGR